MKQGGAVLKLKLKAPAVALLLLTLIFSQQFGTALAVEPTQSRTLPPATAPKPVNPGRVYFPECGHHLSEGFLDFWRRNGRDELFGCPISEEIGTEEGKVVQYFKKGRLEYNPLLQGTDWAINGSTIMTDFLTKATLDERNNPAYNPAPAFKNDANREYFTTTQQGISGGFYKFWKAKGGVKNLGFPLSQEFPIPINGQFYAAQDFERVRLLYSPKTGVTVADMGVRMAELDLVATVPVAKEAGTPDFNTWLWEHWVDVNLTKITTTFMEGDVPIRTNPVVTGAGKNFTPSGTFYIIRRVYNERMRGGTIGAEDYYDLNNVLFTQYFTNQGHALHYAWWRDSFGYYASHGCVNMDYDTSEYAWYFVTIGSRVSIHF
jgi:lipoprotein-anchoring transpeptidase ErfK/SrfK